MVLAREINLPHCRFVHNKSNKDCLTLASVMRMTTNHLWPYILYCISLLIMHICLECRLFFGCNVVAVLEEALSEMLSPNMCTDDEFLCCLPVRMILPYTGSYTLDTASHPTTLLASVLTGNSRCCLLNPYPITIHSHLSSSFCGMKQDCYMYFNIFHILCVN